MNTQSIINAALRGERLDRKQLLLLGERCGLALLSRTSEQLAIQGFGTIVSYSPKVFIPLTRLCRNVCHYCTFAHPPRRSQPAYISIDEVLAIARAGAAAGCREALFTLGDKPELRYTAASEALEVLGFTSTLDYLAAAARAVFSETGLLPHVNPGVMTEADIALLRPHVASMGLMLESVSERLCERGQPHWRSPDKAPAQRIATLHAAGRRHVPFTTGILIGIGETRHERIESLLAIREIHETYGHVQEVIIQNFRAKPGTAMANHPEPGTDEHLWTIAMARLIFGAGMSIQAPPNLHGGTLEELVRAGVNDWGGVSPVTPDHVNPEAPWPHLRVLADDTRRAGRTLVPRLAIVPAYVLEPERWIDASLRTAVLRSSEGRGYARPDRWHAGTISPAPVTALPRAPSLLKDRHDQLVARALSGDSFSSREIEMLFAAEGDELATVARAADTLRRDIAGEDVTYVANCNINYTNICSFSCGFCAFAKGGSSSALRGPAYDLSLNDIAVRVQEARRQGATEVCLQGGIHPHYDGQTYLNVVRKVKEAAPEIHVHAFSPLEIRHGADTLGLSLTDYLTELRRTGLASLPGTAAEILDDRVRQVICPDKLDTADWLAVMRAAHDVGLRTTATIMFGHVDHPRHWAAHLLRLRQLQAETGGFTEFVPLPFVHMEAPLWRRGKARSGPTFREAVLMHAVARLVLHPLIPNIQTSWVKMGLDGASLCLQAGANDVGGTLMSESITSAAGGVHGRAQSVDTLGTVAARIGRPLRQRTTFYTKFPSRGGGPALTADLIATCQPTLRAIE